MDKRIVYIISEDDFGNPHKHHRELDLDKYSGTDIKDWFLDYFPDYEVKRIYFISDEGTELTIYPIKGAEEYASEDEYGDMSDLQEGNEEIINKYNEEADYGKEDEDNLYEGRDILDSITVERCDDCNMEISKAKITNEKFKDSVKCKVTDSKDSISFDGKTEEVIEAVALATGQSKEDIINQLISKL